MRIVENVHQLQLETFSFAVQIFEGAVSIVLLGILKETAMN